MNEITYHGSVSDRGQQVDTVHVQLTRAIECDLACFVQLNPATRTSVRFLRKIITSFKLYASFTVIRKFVNFLAENK